MIVIKLFLGSFFVLPDLYIELYVTCFFFLRVLFCHAVGALLGRAKEKVSAYQGFPEEEATSPLGPGQQSGLRIRVHARREVCCTWYQVFFFFSYYRKEQTSTSFSGCDCCSCDAIRAAHAVGRSRGPSLSWSVAFVVGGRG